MNFSLTENQIKNITRAFLALLVTASLALLAKTVSELKTVSTLGKAPTQNTISVSGTGDAYATPDIAEISFEVTNEAKTVVEAQDNVSKRSNEIIAYLKSVGIAKEDIKTLNYNIYPRYEYVNRSVCDAYGNCPISGRQVFMGYVVTNSVHIKIRDLAGAGDILAGIGSRKVTNLSGLNFIVEDENAVKTTARKNAIEDAQKKANVLAKDLGVRLGKIVSFSESGNYPMYYAKTMGIGGAAEMNAPTAPDVMPGQNKTTLNVTIVYEIE